MTNERAKQDALDEYHRVVALHDEWYANGWPTDNEELETELGRQIRFDDFRNRSAAVRAAFDESLVEVIADASAAGIPQWMFTEFRGWLSHNDVRRLLERARKPYDVHPEDEWPQTATLKAVKADSARIALRDPVAALMLEKSARALLRRWAKEVPREPGEEAVRWVASRWRAEHVKKWKEARRKLLKDIDALGRTEVRR
ncbi:MULTISPECIES: hypothetical protein [unclassified Nocardioides]|uniref:hypothetical protein n=1 Tax=unclassified Nocardioides TaxID=2615069 RepID=UPI0007037D47|nr:MULTISPECIES: hypothetical protein [unclassified Nocardioides]KRC46474.1 hypothetical protein ASE19_21885 [Nocardioides sp. Root79]KRC69818.1 hypothetical protein ASE20_14735 [Nocardioides sp. Root240]